MLLLHATLAAPFHQLSPVVFQVPPPSEGFGAVAAFESHVRMTAGAVGMAASAAMEHARMRGVFIGSGGDGRNAGSEIRANRYPPWGRRTMR